MLFLPTTLWLPKWNNTHLVLKIESGLGRCLAGTFAILSVERSGEYNKEETLALR